MHYHCYIGYRVAQLAYIIRRWHSKLQNPGRLKNKTRPNIPTFRGILVCVCVCVCVCVFSVNQEKLECWLTEVFPMAVWKHAWTERVYRNWRRGEATTALQRPTAKKVRRAWCACVCFFGTHSLWNYAKTMSYGLFTIIKKSLMIYSYRNCWI